MKKKNLFLFCVCVVCSVSIIAQNNDNQNNNKKAWTLQDCIEYAQKNNVTVQSTELQSENSQLQLSSAKMAITPSVNANIGQNFSFGRATGSDNIIADRSQSSTSFSASASMPLFSGLKILNQIKAAKFNLYASLAEVENAKDNVALNIAAAYLQTQYNHELVSIARNQYEQSTLLVKNTQTLVAEGRKSESELYENLAQQAQYEQTLTESENAYSLSVLDLCQTMNYPDVENFVLADASDLVNKIADSELLLAFPTETYNYAFENNPSMIVQRNRLAGAEKEVKVAQADYYPSLGLNLSYGTGYYHVFNQNNPSFGEQFKVNGSPMVGLNLSIPIYNKMTVNHAVKMSKINVKLKKLEIQNTQHELRKQIQTAYYNAIAAKQKLAAAEKTEQASHIAFDFENKKYQNGRSTTYEYTQAQVRWRKSQAEYAQAKYELVLRSKILDFYRGIELSL